MATAYGQKLRLNVVALIDDVTVGRLLVCVEDYTLVEDLGSKVRAALVKSSIEGRLLRLTNRFGADLPSDEQVGHVLRDAEEVIAVLVSPPEDGTVRQQLANGAGELMTFARASPSHQAGLAKDERELSRLMCATEWKSKEDLVQGQEESFATAMPMSPQRLQNLQHSLAQNTVATQQCKDIRTAASIMLAHDIPGPAEAFEEDLVNLPVSDELVERMKLPSGNDWSVEGLSPKLREYISTRFRETHASAAEPGKSFIAVSMRPRARAGGVPCQAIHYSIARIDIMEFERLCGQKIQETRSRTDHFRRCEQALKSLLDRGASAMDYAPNLLPYRYRDTDKFTSMLSETDLPTFGQAEGFRPTIVIDNSGATGEAMVVLRSALKRILYSFLVAKSKFNLLKFSPQGNPVAWANGMVPPTAQVLREAEDFLDGIRPVRQNHSSNLIEGMQMALAHPEADVVYVLTSGLPKRCSLEIATRSMRLANVRDVPVHIVGVECEPKAELELRRLAEDNYGSFRHKRFHQVPSNFSSSIGSSGGLDIDSSDSNDARMTISGQMSILEIMLDEQERHTVDWLEEQKCANRLLLTTQSQQPVPDTEAIREMNQRAALSDVRWQQKGHSESRLQELVDMHNGRSLNYQAPVVVPSPSPVSSSAPVPPMAAGYLGAGAERKRVAARAERRATSLPRGGGAAAADAIRRPSVVNPWDRPGAVIKPSQMIEKSANEARGGVPLPQRPGQPRSARNQLRPSSASRVEARQRQR